jgi:predicted RNA-binding protein Jag
MSNYFERFSLDSNGNLYIDDYWVHVNRYDHLDFYKVNSESTIQKVSEEIKLKEDALHIKVIEKEIESLQKKYNEEENEEDFDEIAANHLTKYVFNPELKYIKENHMNEENDSDEEIYNDPKIIITGDFNLNNYEFDISNYEVYTIDSSNNLIAYTNIINDNPLYRITLSERNELHLNIIGTKTIYYKIKDSETKSKPIELEVITINYQQI